MATLPLVLPKQKARLVGLPVVQRRRRWHFISTEGCCFDSCSTRRALFRPVYSGMGWGGGEWRERERVGGWEEWKGFHHLLKQTFFPWCLERRQTEKGGRNVCV